IWFTLNRRFLRTFGRLSCSPKILLSPRPPQASFLWHHRFALPPELDGRFGVALHWHPDARPARHRRMEPRWRTLAEQILPGHPPSSWSFAEKMGERPSRRQPAPQQDGRQAPRGFLTHGGLLHLPRRFKGRQY